MIAKEVLQMLIINETKGVKIHPILRYLPTKFRKLLTFTELYCAEELRLRKGLPFVVNFKDKSYFITKDSVLTNDITKAVIVSNQDINEALELIVKSSLYTAQNSLKQGFVTIEGGNRIGICGSAVINNSNITSIKNITGLNYRIAKEIDGASDNLIDTIYNDNKILNTLIISPPCCGKTTILRDIAKKLSNDGVKVCVADERNEICAVSKGYLGFDLGYSLDVLEGASKSDAFSILIRSMSPDVIITDELGGNEDLVAVKKAISSGVTIIASIHSKSREELFKNNSEFKSVFDCFITLNRTNGPGTIGEIYRV